MFTNHDNKYGSEDYFIDHPVIDEELANFFIDENIKMLGMDLPAPWTECFATLEETIEVLKSVGFEIIEADKAPDAQLWWEEYAKYDHYASEEGRDSEVIEKDKGRWTTFEYIIAKKQKI